ncbi:MAG: alcohol dehydrogenase catalytic domain-containing protein, partial [Ancrocorticia populi]|uniref:alcohol dehydrogenase catalytic domain-containing protein n=1 Tax=Ancrocorticia populi TaxID=2175228 RepID=UPI003F92B6FC
MAKMMDAALMYGPGDIRVEQVEVPECPDGGFVVEVGAIGMCGSDIRNLTSDSRSGAYPWIYGHEVVGRVAEVAPGVTAYRPGQWIYVYPLAHCLKCENCRSGHSEQCSEVEEYTANPGGFAQYIAYSSKRVDRGATFEIPDGVDPVRATLAEPLSSTYACLENIDVKMGDSVAILGSGPVGIMLAILARMRGASQVIVTDTNQARLDKAAQFEIDALVNSAETDAVSEVLRLTGGRGADKVISANPSTIAQQQALLMARKAGTVVFFGGV